MAVINCTHKDRCEQTITNSRKTSICFTVRYAAIA